MDTFLKIIGWIIIIVVGCVVAAGVAGYILARILLVISKWLIGILLPWLLAIAKVVEYSFFGLLAILAGAMIGRILKSIVQYMDDRYGLSKPTKIVLISIPLVVGIVFLVLVDAIVLTKTGWLAATCCFATTISTHSLVWKW